MVIQYLYIVSIAILPGETDSPFIINTDSPLTFSITRQLLKAICRGKKEKFRDAALCNIVSVLIPTW
jgi:hypothetical protein